MRRRDRLWPTVPVCRPAILQPTSSFRFVTGGNRGNGERLDPLFSPLAPVELGGRKYSVRATDFFSCIWRVWSVYSQCRDQRSLNMNTSFNQQLEATGDSSRDWPCSVRVAPYVFVG